MLASMVSYRSMLQRYGSNSKRRITYVTIPREAETYEPVAVLRRGISDYKEGVLQYNLSPYTPLAEYVALQSYSATYPALLGTPLSRKRIGALRSYYRAYLYHQSVPNHTLHILGEHSMTPRSQECSSRAHRRRKYESGEYCTLPRQ